MKYIKQLMIILFITFLGEILHFVLPFPVPASIYGMVLLFLALELKIIRLSDVRETGKFLIEIMPIMFIPAGVGVLDAWGILKPHLIPIVIIMVVSTIVVMGASGKVTEAVIHQDKDKKGEDAKND